MDVGEGVAGDAGDDLGEFDPDGKEAGDNGTPPASVRDEPPTNKGKEASFLAAVLEHKPEVVVIKAETTEGGNIPSALAREKIPASRVEELCREDEGASSGGGANDVAGTGEGELVDGCAGSGAESGMDAGPGVGVGEVPGVGMGVGLGACADGGVAMGSGTGMKAGMGSVASVGGGVVPCPCWRASHRWRNRLRNPPPRTLAQAARPQPATLRVPVPQVTAPPPSPLQPWV